MKFSDRMRDERGIALIVALLVALVVATISVGAAMLSTNAAAINKYSERQSTLESAAEAGIEEARSAVNGNSALYPDSGFATLENGVVVTDASNNPIPGVTRTTYVGPTGITSGQYGVYGSIVSVTQDGFNNQVVRRGEIRQESFAKYAYFTTIEGTIWFANNDQIWGPVHSNDRIRIYSTGATFHSEVSTGRDIYQPGYGTFHQGYSEWVPIIPLPQTADLLALSAQATAGNTRIVGNTNGGHGEGTTRIHFMALDLNADGDATDENEGFMRVYQHLTDPNWVTGDQPGGGWDDSENCGDFANGPGDFTSADDRGGSWANAYTHATSRCFLGGSDELWDGNFTANDVMGGSWLQWPGAVSALVTAQYPAQAQYLWPITRALNPNFKGVIYVQGKVVLSGTLRGKVTVAATDDIILGDDVRYITDPGAGTCSDILGIFSGDDVVLADNALNAPIIPFGSTYRSYDETNGEFIHGIVLALNIFTAENYNAGSSSAQPCEGTPAGRGCIYLTGGIIQRQRGAVGLTSGRGYVKRYSYDQCAANDPPPYFPTTGHFIRGRIFEVDPTGFNVANYYSLLTPP
jgi:hypothetical protein